jgi:hypothetical protein
MAFGRQARKIHSWKQLLASFPVGDLCVHILQHPGEKRL